MPLCLPFLRVPDVLKTIEWQRSIGFTCLGTHQEPGCELDWALIDWQGAQFMLYSGGNKDYVKAKDAGLYFVVDTIDEIIKVIREKAEIIEITPETEYGKKEIVFKDINGFQVTFGCEP